MSLYSPVGVGIGLSALIAADVGLALAAQLYVRLRSRDPGIGRSLRLRSARRVVGALPAFMGSMSTWIGWDRSLEGLVVALFIGLVLGSAMASVIGILGTVEYFADGRFLQELKQREAAAFAVAAEAPVPSVPEASEMPEAAAEPVAPPPALPVMQVLATAAASSGSDDTAA